MKAVFLVIIASFIALSCAPPSFEASGYVFSYGVAAYPFPIKSLTYTDDDARAVYTMFNDAGYEAHLRIDDGGEYYSGYTALPATLEQLEADIAYVAGQIEKRDTVVFYFSGHGNSISPADDYINDEPNDDWFLLYYPSYMVDTDPKAAYLSDDTLGRLLSDIPRGKVVVLIDACYSGGFIASSPYPGMWSDPYYRFNEEPFTPPSLGELIAAWNGGLGKYDVSADTALMITAAGEYERSFE
ncbi:MAG: caspase family protein, partial [Spirochaetales bacterium]|nr:caspase family protein [Spirochaetales bacterium]